MFYSIVNSVVVWSVVWFPVSLQQKLFCADNKASTQARAEWVEEFCKVDFLDFYCFFSIAVSALFTDFFSLLSTN